MESVAGESPLAEGTKLSWLAGMSGRLRIDVAGKPARLLELRDGVASVRPATGDEPTEAVIACEQEETLSAFTRGALNPVVGALRGDMVITGDRAFAIKVILGLQAAIHPPPASAREVPSPETSARKEG